MESFYFKIKFIPDFTLSKYSAANSISAISDINQIFIRQLHGLGKELDIIFHLYYIFDPEINSRDKMSIIIECEYDESSNVSESQLYRIISSFAIFDIYTIEKADPSYLLLNNTFKYFTAMYKKQIYTAPKYEKNNTDIKQCYYSLSEWKMRSNSRFFSTLKLMCKMDHPVILRIDAICATDSEKVVNDINGKGIYKSIYDQSMFQASISSGETFKSGKDTAASNIARFYEKYMENMRTQIQFYASVCVLSDCVNDGNMILDTLSSEVIESGLTEKDHYDAAKTDPTGFKADYLKNSPLSYGRDDIFDFQKVWYMRSLYTAEELSHFWAFPYLNRNERLSIRKETDPAIVPNSSDVIDLGYISDDSFDEKNRLRVRIPIKNFCKHGYICGVPGSGKTYTMKHIIHSLNRKQIPFLIFEPAKREYRELYMIDESRKKQQYGAFTDNDNNDNIILFSPHANTLFPFHINPLQIPVGVSVSEYIATLHSVFLGAFSWPMPTPIILQKALEIAYENYRLYGNDIISEDIKNFPTISDLYDAFKKAMDSYSYAGESKSNISGVLESRIGSLMNGYPGEVFNIGFSSVEPNSWTLKSIIIELEALSVEQANFVSLLILSLIRLHLKRSDIISDSLRHVIFFEEAHNLIGPCAVESNDENNSAKLAATVMIKNMLAEVRAYKEGIIIADQLPTALAPEVLKNTSLKIAHRQLSQDEREAISKVMSADNLQIEEMTQFTEGKALVMYEDKNVVKPFKIQVETQFNYSGASVSDDDILKKVIHSNWYDQVFCTSIFKRVMLVSELCQNIENCTDAALENKMFKLAIGYFKGIQNAWRVISYKFYQNKDFCNDDIIELNKLIGNVKEYLNILIRGE